ncbi:MAG: hypothetical protein EOO61_06695, partial [Hymenobacter sp.]
MKTLIFLSAAVLLASCGGNPKNKQDNDIIGVADTVQSADTTKTESAVYKIVVKTSSIPGDIDTLVTRNLSEPVKALTAFYAAMGGTMCDGETCKLTTALGLGKQGSDRHKELIKKYFPGDKVAETVVKQDCYLRPSGASTFSDFEYLTITGHGDTLTVDYSLMYYNHGSSKSTTGPDTYLFKDNIFKKLEGMFA